jgi:tetratricopeptide (TPR) repeat protein/nucleoside 2-deoxyribosyltransferase
MSDLAQELAALAARHDGVLRGTAPRSAPRVAALTQLDAAFREFGPRLDASAASGNERARFRSWWGMVHFDLSEAQESSPRYDRALELYRAAAELVDETEPALRAAIDQNTGNALFRRSKNEDVIDLADAVLRFDRARRGFQQARDPRAAPLLSMIDSVAKTMALHSQVLTLKLGPGEPGADALRAFDRGMLDVLRLRLELDAAADRVDAVRAATLRALLESARRLTEPVDDSLMASAERATLSREFMGQVMRMLGEGPEARTSRGKELVAATLPTVAALLEHCLRPDVDGDGALHAATEFRDVLRAVAEANEESQVRRLEDDRLRPLALAARERLRESHLTLLRPLWGATAVARTTDRVVVHVRPHAAGMVKAVCESRRLAVVTPVVGADHGAARWDAVRAAALVIADVGDRATSAWACYEIGLALAVGTPVITLVGDDGGPFDVPSPPVAIAAGADALAAAIDRTLVGPSAVDGAMDRDELVRRALDVFEGVPGAVPLLEQAQASGRLSSAVDQLTRLAAGRGVLALLPTWRPARDPQFDGVIFHVMPFREVWSDEVSQRTSVEVRAGGRRYVRHDHVVAVRLLPSLWTALVSAAGVLVDLTGLNPNVAVECGLAHALGQPTALIAQRGTLDRIRRELPPLGQLHVEEYDLSPGAVERAVAAALHRLAPAPRPAPGHGAQLQPVRQEHIVTSEPPKSYAVALHVASLAPAVRGRALERVGDAVRRFQWPPALAAAAAQVIETAMVELPSLVNQTLLGAGVAIPAFVPVLRTLQAWLDGPFTSGESPAIADELLSRVYIGLRLLACVPGALSAQGLFTLLLAHDVIDAPSTNHLDAAIIARFPGTVLLPVAQLAQGLHQMQMSAIAASTAHPIYGNVSTDEVVRLEMGRRGIR